MKKPTKTKTDCERSRPALGHPWERLGFLWTCSQHEPIRRLPGDPEDLKRPGQRGRDVRTGHRHHPTPAPGPPAPLAPSAQTPASREQGAARPRLRTPTLRAPAQGDVTSGGTPCVLGVVTSCPHRGGRCGSRRRRRGRLSGPSPGPCSPPSVPVPASAAVAGFPISPSPLPDRGASLPFPGPRPPCVEASGGCLAEPDKTRTTLQPSPATPPPPWP